MIVITLTKVPKSLRGDLTKWCQEVQSGVYVGNFNARIRDLLWERILSNIGKGEATLIYSTNNELGYTFKTTRKDKEIIDFDGIPLLKQLKMQPIAHEYGFSKVSQYHQARKYRKNVRIDNIFSSVVSIDIETTGLDFSKDAILSIGAVKYSQKNKDYKKFYRIIKSNCKIPNEISKLTGLTQALLVSEGVGIGDALTDLRKFIGDKLVIGYNLSFDYNFLVREYKKLHRKIFMNELKDLLPIVKKSNIFLDNYKLSTVLREYNITNQHPHHALFDARAVLDLLKKLIEKGRINI
ncbi:type I-E CRISPR-associated endoribonuclease Cas2e [Lactobacillus sp.]|uniref:type I-E CRISPR-associated endoribonuclease Cas2e n=1 Tax=Lactobacillus sp. TaxID=1591 RepID=UPI0019ADA35C|nr:type I-E CRISPR-associated endoribonuclease Cas2e [Lactobacillus sp.]MBD5430108.1 type I-E CRISPR-associated endoribonuclease Cas2 [Lactobacillus sp.]MBD5430459.1 type I-E CRISPR-associated endoribonuclease Cas2 [Lactobacillus sp.]MBD5430588.1 type I-E CRISPR-associated endoribonuclease Cas2 [Lactobacillus sp.]